MYRLKVNKLLNQIDKTPYWLSKQTGISPNNMIKICNGETVNIRLETINKLCSVFDCTPGDLFEDDSK